ncbi:hypothetical protein [Piscinibacter koreensis]|uniref:Serine/threonine protein kinase n=1 Tax=Piscinibacter koreensis TaxID=2742824 RepID=A0A7Y6NSC9_9BURK|nr:hypothetical protein [Schlegelella koreensis]NUZ08444.1 hypothetical protein [Schlegelella koreensis]
MNTKLSFGIAAAALALMAQGALAQSSDASGVGAQATTQRGQATRSLAPAGEGPGLVGSQNTGRSTKTRAQRKSETLMERNMGGLTPAGQGGVKPDHMNPVVPQAKSRAAVKAETQAAARSGTLQPAGEAAQPSSLPAKRG